jgi:hypothetical protein
MHEGHSPGAGQGETWPDPAALWQAWWGALGLRAPLSGDVTQAIDTSLVRGIGDQLGFININATQAGDPALERRIVQEVASYGRQLGRLLDAVDVLIRHDTRGKLARDDQRALDELQALRAEINDAKERSAADQVDRLVSQIRALRGDPEANRAALRRIGDALKDG